MNWKRVFGVVFVFVLFLFGAVFLVVRKSNQLSGAPEYGKSPRPVTVANAEQKPFVETQSYLAEVESARKSRLSPRVRATVDTVYVDEGDRVQRGDVLLELDRQEIDRSIESLKQTIQQVRSERRARKAERDSLKDKVEYWEKEVERYERLVSEKYAPRATLDKHRETLSDVRGKLTSARETINSLKHRIQSLQQTLSERRTRRGYYTIRSPYDARVTDRLVDPGDMGIPGAAVIRLEDISGARLVFDVPQNEKHDIRMGNVVRFGEKRTADTAEITLVHPSLNEKRMIRAEVRLPDDVATSVRTGEYVSIDVVINRHSEVAVVPRTAIIESPEGQPYVFVVEEGMLVGRSVTPVGHADGLSAVKGLAGGEQVVKHSYLGWTRLSDGQAVVSVQ